MKDKQAKLILKLILIYIILQPIFDIFSFLSIRNFIPNISTYLKPIFVFGVATYSLFFLKKKEKRWWIYIASYILFMIGHFIILKRTLIPVSTILHEYRFLLNIAYMIALFIIFNSIYNNYINKSEVLKKLKQSLTITFFLYGILLLIAILTNTSALTYEYSDDLKHGFKGWFDSGQIFGHALSILFPILIYTILKPSKKWYEKVIPLSLILIIVSLIGTKVPYYIVIVVLFIFLLLSIFLSIINRDHKTNKCNIIILIFSILVMIFTYKFTPVYYNSELNKSVANISVETYDKDDINGSKNSKKIEELLNHLKQTKGKGFDTTELEKYYNWDIQASKYLDSLYSKNKLHPSNIRVKQFFYSYKKYSLADFEYKLFGIGYLNQYDGLSIESDFFMSIFCFGIFGFVLFLIIPIIEFFKSTIFILRNIKKIDLEFYTLYIGIGIFFCISMYAGYTFIYTNFSIFLVALISMLKIKKNILQQDFKVIDNNKLSFLLLHLGYGGIESATINSANALSESKDIEIISFYKLNKNISNKLNKNIKIKYLYNGSPNKEEIFNAIKNKNIVKLIKESFKAINILYKKKNLIKKEIINSNSKYIVSTRVEFSELLSLYGNDNCIKIAQEHHHHNNNKKYINKLKYNYSNINYLCALTNTLKKDYESFLIKSNKTTKVVLLPNMLEIIPEKTSKLGTNNIISVSRLDEGKRINELIDIYSKLDIKNSKYYIIGDGKEFNNLKDKINTLDLSKKVELLGYKDKSEIEKYMLNSSVFVMASISEGLPMVLLEAMSYGIPCIAYETDSGVDSIIEDNKNGFIIKDRNEKEFIDKLNLLISNKSLLKDFGVNAHEKANEFSKEEILKIWYKIIN